MLDFVKRRSINEELARLASKDGFTIQGITKSEFIRQAFASRGMKMPTSNTSVMKLIHDFFDEAKAKTVQDIAKRSKEGHSVSLTLDEWTSVSNKRYMNINIHFADGAMINLGLIPISGSLPAEKIVALVKSAVEGFGLKPNDVFGATTDGAAVMIKFGKSSGYMHQLCYNHGLHLAVCDVLYKNVPNELIPQDDEESDDDYDDSDEEYENEDNVISDAGLYRSSFSVTLKQIRKVIRIFRASPVKNALLQEKISKVFGKSLKLLLDVRTRWNSTVTMLERFLKVWKCIDETLEDLGQKDFHLTKKDVESIQNLMSALQPIKLSSEALGRRDANLLTAEGSLSFLFTKLKDQNTCIATELYDAILKRIGERRNKELVSVMKFLNNKTTVTCAELPVLTRSQIFKFIKDIFLKAITGITVDLFRARPILLLNRS
ncbi:uncharacterized protein LOC134217293 [Armigeres subalbatus]|uniref:uncharacterized protein LOC134217293 n=1 Tax=Armigeres subalbatus TaxID=124917 RepID=UPI002ED44F26